MAAKPLPSQRLLNRVFHYDPATGLLTWRKRPLWMFAVSIGGRQTREAICNTWNRRYAGKRSGNNVEWSRVRVFGRPFLVARLIWKMVYGTDPETIDHINRKSNDNRISNLRDVSQHVNCLNRGVPRNCKSGVTGVRWDARRGAWIATIIKNGQAHYLGQFHDINLAILSRRQAEEALGFFAIDSVHSAQP